MLMLVEVMGAECGMPKGLGSCCSGAVSPVCSGGPPSQILMKEPRKGRRCVGAGVVWNLAPILRLAQVVGTGEVAMKGVYKC